MSEETSDRRLNPIEQWRRAVVRLAQRSDPKEWQELESLCDFLWELQRNELPAHEARRVARSLLVIAERAVALAVTTQQSRAEAEETTRNIRGLQEARLKIDAWDTEEE